MIVPLSSNFTRLSESTLNALYPQSSGCPELSRASTPAYQVSYIQITFTLVILLLFLYDAASFELDSFGQHTTPKYTTSFNWAFT